MTRMTLPHVVRGLLVALALLLAVVELSRVTAVSDRRPVGLTLPVDLLSR